MRRKNVHVAIVASILIGCGLSPLVAAPSVILSDIKGKVEIKALNASAWTPATEGMKISTLTTISTGFDSSVTVTMEKNNMFVKPLTRMTVDKIVEEQGNVSTSCYLRVGSVKASVKSAEGVKQDFKVQSPYSTASVRGTEFDYDGLLLAVREGVVVFIPGRPTRDIQLPSGAEGKALPDLSGDFTGSPDIPPTEGVEYVVPAGFEAVLEVNADGTLKGDISGDRDSLESDSVITTSDSDSLAGEFVTTNQSKGIKNGSVTITLTLPK